jgi:fructokinase
VIVVAGEALIDLMPCRGEPQQFEARPGGAPCNVAVGLARLGRRTCLLGRIGTDPFGRLLRQHLAGSGVDASMVVTATQKTTLAVAALDGQGKAEYSFYANGTADWQWTDAEVPRVLPADAGALYVGGLALRLSPGAAVLEGLMRRTRQQRRALVFFDPNVRTGFGFSAAVERARVERQLRLAHVIKASEDDIALLYPGHDYREIAARWQGGGAGLVAVTLGPAGVYALAPDGTEIIVPAVSAQVVDTVGAGDAFAAAMLDQLVEEMSAGAAPGPDPAPGPAEALREVGVGALRGLLERASVSAALTCERPGAQSPDAGTLDAAMADVPRSTLSAEQRGSSLSGERREIGLEPPDSRLSPGKWQKFAEGWRSCHWRPACPQGSVAAWSTRQRRRESGRRPTAGDGRPGGPRTTSGGSGGSRSWWSGCSGAVRISPSGWAWRRCRPC